MTQLLGRALAALLAAQNLVAAAVLAAFVALALRAFTVAALDRSRSTLATLTRLLAAAAWLAAGSCYWIATAASLHWSAGAVLAALGAATAILGVLLLRLAAGRPVTSELPSLWSGLLQATLMRAGFVMLTEDQPVLRLDVTGETGTQLVRWAPPDQPLREERMTTHRVVVRRPDGVAVAEGWIYGDQVAVKGRVLRLSPVLNALGLPNLCELQFLHNGYDAAERHNRMPHVALPLPPLGPLAVSPLWRPWQRRLLASWERGTRDGSAWAVRSVTTESTYYPLTDAEGRSVKQVFQLMLTPGGLSSS
jgi:hypothetical protein